MTVILRRSVMSFFLASVVTGAAVAAPQDVPLPRPAPGTAQADEVQPAPVAQAAAAPSPVLGAAAAEFQRVQNWTVKCRTSGERRCILYQTVLFGDENPSVIVARAGYVQGVSDPVLEIRVPMGVRLATGLAVAVDNQAAFTLPFERCAQDGCLAQATLRKDLLDRFSKGETLDLQVEDQARNAIRVRMSLVGFATALGMANQ